jgi:hypothetical protein
MSLPPNEFNDFGRLNYSFVLAHVLLGAQKLVSYIDDANLALNLDSDVLVAAEVCHVD